MSLPASDDFAGSGTLSASWTNISESWARVSGVVQTAASTGFGLEYWNADSFASTHYAEVISAEDGAGSYYGPAINISGSTISNVTGYFMVCRDDYADVRTANGDGTNTIIHTMTTPPTVGQVVRLKDKDATKLQVFYDGVQSDGDISVAAAATYRGGAAGMFLYASTANITSWAADDVAGGGGGGGTPPSTRLAILGVG